MDQIRAKYGAAAILRAKRYTLGGTAIQRSQLMGDIRRFMTAEQKMDSDDAARA
jgi:hypothetical protein